MSIPKTPLVSISVPGIYAGGVLPRRMAKCTPDTAAAIHGVAEDLRSLGFELRLSDLYRSRAMQNCAHQDYVKGRKTSYSPPPGGSLHEAGRSMDIDLSRIGVSLARFWEIARARGFTPVIDSPVVSRSEAWHFDCRGSHNAIYEYMRNGRAGHSVSPYKQMARSAILAIGERVSTLPDQKIASVQAFLIRLGFDPGRIDGVMGPRTRAALREAGTDEDEADVALSARIRDKFSEEFSLSEMVEGPVFGDATVVDNGWSNRRR